MSDYLDRYKRRMNRNGKHVGDSLTNNTIAFIEATFHASPTFRVMEVESYNNPEIKEMDARVVEIERLGSLREIILRPNDNLEIGTYVKFDGDTWLLFDKHGGTGSTSIKMTAIRCNRKIKWMGRDGDPTPKEYDCVASATDIGSKSKQSKNEIEWNKYDVRLPIGQLFVTVEANPDTKSIELNDRFVFGRNVYEVTGIDDITGIDENDYGIIQLTVKITTQRDGDFEDGMAVNNYKEDVEVDETENGENGGRLW